MEAKWCVYMLRCGDGTFYTGITNDLDKRIAAHRKGSGAKYTAGRGPFSVFYTETGLSKSAASKREHIIKKMSRKKKEGLTGGSMKIVSVSSGENSDVPSIHLCLGTGLNHHLCDTLFHASETDIDGYVVFDGNDPRAFFKYRKDAEFFLKNHQSYEKP